MFSPALILQLFKHNVMKLFYMQHMILYYTTYGSKLIILLTLTQRNLFFRNYSKLCNNEVGIYYNHYTYKYVYYTYVIFYEYYISYHISLL